MSAPRESIRIFLCGDVMTGRGIDQIMAHPSDATLFEPSITSATDYVDLAEAVNGMIPRRVPPAYVWGTALGELARRRPDVRIINLETSITRSDTYAPKGINYRMNPENADCLAAASIDCCVLANNHMLDWGRAGLLETLDTLKQFNIKIAGAGRNTAEARRPAILDLNGSARVLVFSFASVTSGSPRSWAARTDVPGINLLPDLSEHSAIRIADEISRTAQPQDIVVVSIHWGSNWGYEIPTDQRRFAHALIDKARISVLHGHSAHHAKAIEVYRNRLILYGCGDFLNDYEGIEGYEAFRDDLALMYFADVDTATGDLRALELTPLQIKCFQLQPASSDDTTWLAKTLDEQSAGFGTRVKMTPDGRLAVSWQATG
jgi:poly-gamma-glutamate synthesis protein (capsule biosynthesis protein)